MSTKTKNQKLPLDQLSEIASQAGIILMTAAVTLGMLEAPDHNNSKIILPNQPAFVFAENGEENNPVRREREDTAPHFISYSEVQRTAPRSGRQ